MATAFDLMAVEGWGRERDLYQGGVRPSKLKRGVGDLSSPLPPTATAISKSNMADCLNNREILNVNSPY